MIKKLYLAILLRSTAPAIPSRQGVIKDTFFVEILRTLFSKTNNLSVSFYQLPWFQTLHSIRMATIWNLVLLISVGTSGWDRKDIDFLKLFFKWSPFRWFLKILMSFQNKWAPLRGPILTFWPKYPLSFHVANIYTF